MELLAAIGQLKHFRRSLIFTTAVSLVDPIGELPFSNPSWLPLPIQNTSGFACGKISGRNFLNVAFFEYKVIFLDMF